MRILLLVTEKINSEHKQEEPLFRRFVLSSSLFTAEMRMCEGDVLSVKDLSLSAFVTKRFDLSNFFAVSHFVRVGVTFFSLISISAASVGFR